ncbi:hypothetical protein HUA76_04465 [Myxococcus sp. CA056]|uniref:hypothetical protein n=1 Tax=unclassified Myxococcus TaxID=2648731 RepID=UPI00157A263A|nr:MULTISPECIES: hypothetical protein [unclassified Myxococcus]NTX10034.1 hypothetical protein [Myxococcus sp. CA056]NTX40014.1 hypothetical protein [Myxococcus sp. CA033]NTX54251.1 hypothetical protein [Myxococcus sp. CA039A]
MLSALTVAAAVALGSPAPETGGPLELARFAGHVVACTEDGLEVLDSSGKPVRGVSTEDGLPSPFCLALEVAGDRLFAATDAGIVSLDASFRVEPVLDVRWHALPDAEDASEAEYVERLDALTRTLPPDATYTVLTSRHAGTEDGRVMELGTHRVWTVAGPVLHIEEERRGVRVATEGGVFLIDTEGRLATR